MGLKPSDHLRKVRCTIDDVYIKEGLLYYCKNTTDYYLLQNEKDGSTPNRWDYVKKKYKYKFSWVCQMKGRTLESLNVINLQFINAAEKVYELWV